MQGEEQIEKISREGDSMCWEPFPLST